MPAISPVGVCGRFDGLLYPGTKTSRSPFQFDGFTHTWYGAPLGSGCVSSSMQVCASSDSERAGGAAGAAGPLGAVGSGASLQAASAAASVATSASEGTPVRRSRPCMRASCTMGRCGGRGRCGRWPRAQVRERRRRLARPCA
jgi:hypothetical protein